jgi:hypothetical protein
VRRSSPDFALLAATSAIGMDAEVLCKRYDDGLLVATLIQLNTPVARAVWDSLSAQHRLVLRRLVEEAAGVAETRPRPAH